MMQQSAVDEVACREAARRLDVAIYVERSHVPAATRAARRLLGEPALTPENVR